MANWLDNIPNTGGSWTGPSNMAPAVTPTTGQGSVRPVPKPSDIDKQYFTNRMLKPILTPIPPETPRTPTFEEFVASLNLGGGGGYTAPDLSGYNSMLEDLVGREQGYARRKKEQEGYIKGVIESARQRSEAEKGNIAGRYQTLLDQAATRRAQETAALQSGEAARIDTRDAARAALGVAGGEDLTSAVAEGSVANVGAAGDVSTRDADIQQSIENQQISNQIATLDPMRMQAFMDLRNNYEERLAGLAAERAAIKGQIAQVQATPRATGGGGLSVSEALGLREAYDQMINGDTEPVDLGDSTLKVLSTWATANPANQQLYQDIWANQGTWNQGYGQSTTGKLMDPFEVANLVVKNNPSYAPAYNFIVDLIKSGQ